MKFNSDNVYFAITNVPGITVKWTDGAFWHVEVALVRVIADPLDLSIAGRCPRWTPGLVGAVSWAAPTERCSTGAPEADVVGDQLVTGGRQPAPGPASEHWVDCEVVACDSVLHALGLAVLHLLGEVCTVQGYVRRGSTKKNSVISSLYFLSFP